MKSMNLLKYFSLLLDLTPITDDRAFNHYCFSNYNASFYRQKKPCILIFSLKHVSYNERCFFHVDIKRPRCYKDWKKKEENSVYLM